MYRHDARTPSDRELIPMVTSSTLAEAARDPKLLKRRFREWAGSVSAVTTEAAPT